ncbi:MAG: polysaccharide pyruvyl transferase family protein [Treponema sp.]|jgi:hypothetical protein|nr:polysaccharide pyruvyl transferase family protein [Treponema sp.]
MKIGIITVHCANNYGALLQAFALYKKISELFAPNEVFILDYRPKTITHIYNIINFKSIFTFINSIIQLPMSLRRKIMFDFFRKRNIKFISIDEVHTLDYIVCGSDQIWNPIITKGLDPCYFGMIRGFTGKVITYAVSDGGHLDDVEPSLLRKYLVCVDMISVREPTMLPVLERYNLYPQTVLDPVFLFNDNFWKQFSAKRKFKNYIIVYCMGKNDKVIKEAYQLAKKEKLKVIEITYGFPFKRLLKIKHKIISNAGIQDFLSYIQYADYVFTNSFHGLVLSIIFNKYFFLYNHHDEKRNNRLYNVLSQFKLLNRLGFDTNLETLKDIDYNNVNNTLNEKRKESISFLRDVFK